MPLSATLLSETEQRFAERQAAREERIRLIRAGNILQADSPERVRARLNRLGIDRRVAERVVGMKTGFWDEAKRRIAVSAERAKVQGDTEQEKVYAVMAETLGIEPGAMRPAGSHRHTPQVAQGLSCG